MATKISTILLLAIIALSHASMEENGIVEKKMSVPEYEQKLFDSLFVGYNPEIRPDNVTNVKFGMSLISARINEVDSRFEGTAYMKYTWNDPRLTWDESEYGGVSVIRINPSNIWIPDLTLYNSADPGQYQGMDCGQTKVLIYSKGEVLWVPPCRMMSLCGPTTELHTQQMCTLKFGSWVYDGFMLTLGLYNDETKLDVSDLNDVTDWSVLSGVAAWEEKYYPCCTEPYVNIQYNITMKRK